MQRERKTKGPERTFFEMRGGTHDLQIEGADLYLNEIRIPAKRVFRLCLFTVPEARLELACPFGRHPLKMVCLPVPPFGQNVSVDGLEPSTLCLKGRCSTPELHARNVQQFFTAC